MDPTPAPTVIFQILPYELVECILLLLDIKYLLRCRLVNREFNGIIQSSTLLQYFLACKASGVVDNPQSTLSYAERLDMLKKREDAWKKLRPGFEMTIKVNHQPSMVSGLTEGTYFLGDNNLKDLHYCSLPSSLQDNPQWSRISGGGPGQSWSGILNRASVAIYEHDLIVTVICSEVGNQGVAQPYSVDLVLLKFSTGEYHPLARQPRLHVQRSTEADPWIFIRILGDNLAFILNSENGTFHDKLFIFDWKTGCKRLEHETTENTYSSLVFVSPEILLVPNLILSHFEVWHLSLSHPNHEPPRQILSLKFPALSQGWAFGDFGCHTEPNSFRHSIPYLPPRPFFTSPENSMIIANLRFTGPRRLPYTYITHRSSLFDTIQKWTSPPLPDQAKNLPIWLTNEVTVHTMSDPDSGSVRPIAGSKSISMVLHPSPSTSSKSSSSAHRYKFLQVQWADWGPPISRWFRSKDPQAQYLTTLTGQRFAFLSPSPQDWRKSVVSIMDFNPYNVRKNTDMTAREGNGNVDNDGEKELEEFDHDGVFSEEVYMGLKCVVYHAPDDYDFDAVLMDEERVLGLKFDHNYKEESVKVLYFG